MANTCRRHLTPPHKIYHLQNIANRLEEYETKMDTTIAIGVGLGIGLAVLGAGIGQGMTANGAVSGIARQPEAAGKIQTAMIIGLALIESLVILTFVVVNGMAGKVPAPKAPAAGATGAIVRPSTVAQNDGPIVINR
jgi:F-type H+-transporting ATPase subunit c